MYTFFIFPIYFVSIHIVKYQKKSSSIKIFYSGFSMATYPLPELVPYCFFSLFSFVFHPQNRDFQQCYIPLCFSSSETKIASYQPSSVCFSSYPCCCPFISALLIVCFSIEKYCSIVSALFHVFLADRFFSFVEYYSLI